ncbi:DUF998 domain-containing protein [Streptomyces microflavus]|uniref:DUF998 domain-containing protein n=1 Tax=Streptomyces microflavus TaxID=1919 RepID=UPI00380B7C02
MRSAPWWALLPSGGAPVLLVGSWTIAQLRQGPACDPAKQTLSVLTSYGAASYWLMTGMLLMLGACYVVTAHALRAAAFARAVRSGRRWTVRPGTDVGAGPEGRRGPGARGRCHPGPRTAGGMAFPGRRWRNGAGSVGAAAGCVAHCERVDRRVRVVVPGRTAECGGARRQETTRPQA